jgi:chromosome segregation ATPase
MRSGDQTSDRQSDVSALRLQIDALHARLSEKQTQDLAWNDHVARLKEKNTQQKLRIAELEAALESLEHRESKTPQPELQV